MRIDIYQMGVEAARAGLGLYDCPYLLAASMPARTGESLGKWLERVEAWELGWREAKIAGADRIDQSAVRLALRKAH